MASQDSSCMACPTPKREKSAARLHLQLSFLLRKIFRLGLEVLNSICFQRKGALTITDCFQECWMLRTKDANLAK